MGTLGRFVEVLAILTVFAFVCMKIYKESKKKK